MKKRIYRLFFLLFIVTVSLALCGLTAFAESLAETAGEKPAPSAAISYSSIIYTWKTEYNRYQAIEISSKSSMPISMDAGASFYDESGHRLGVDYKLKVELGPKEQTILIFKGDLNCKSITSESMLSKDQHCTRTIPKLSYETIRSGSQVIVEMKNDGDKPAESVEGYVLFFSKGTVVNYASAYFKDSDNQIKPGETIGNTFTASEEFDYVKVYVSGRTYP